MTPIKNVFFGLLFCLFPILSKAQNISVNDGLTADQLVRDILINSPCAAVSNFAISGDNDTPGRQSFGKFDYAGTLFPFANGVVLSTCSAKLVEGPNTTIINNGAASWGGDADLEVQLGIRNTLNATLLEFDFLPLTSQVSFRYIFASEEYHGDAPCRYSDGFAFLLKKANTTDPYVNLAVVPNTSIPVSTTNVHSEYRNSNNALVCAAANEEYYAGENSRSYPTNLNGQTVPLTIKATVVPGTLYHIKLAIADDSSINNNTIYDSAIFLEGGSFNVGTDIGPDRLISSSNPLCQGEHYELDATESGYVTYQWYLDNIPVPAPAGNLPKLDAFDYGPGNYRVELGIGTTGCIAIGEAKIEVAPLPALSATTLVQCDLDHNGRAFFNLTTADAIVKNGIANLSNVSYYTNRPDAEAGTNAIANPENYESIPKIIFAAATNAYGCSGIAVVQLALSNNPANDATLEVCDDDAGAQDGIYEFLLHNADSDILTGLPAGLIVQYYKTEEDALLHPQRMLPDAVAYRNETPFSQLVYAKIVNGSDCYGIAKVQLIVDTFNPAGFEDEMKYICLGETITLGVAAGFDDYQWSQDNTNRNESAQVSAPGDYSVTAFEKKCSAYKKFTVVVPDAPVITSIEVTDLSGFQNTVLIHYTGNSEYQFSLDGIFFQDSPYFTNVAAGSYTAIAKSRCDSDSRAVVVLDYPRFFTPNADGYNDNWNISGLNDQNNAAFVYIYDRFGKFLKQIQAGGKGWDGKFNGQNMPSSDYWFVLNLENGRTVSGHFSLKR